MYVLCILQIYYILLDKYNKKTVYVKYITGLYLRTVRYR